MSQSSTDRRGGTRRRTILRAAGAGVAGATAGCLGILGGGGESVEELPTPVLGNPDADVVVTAFEDFACPHCREFSLSVVPRLESNYAAEGAIRFEHHDFPIPVTGQSWPTAIAARSVQDRRGTDAFWTFAENAYRRQSSLGMGVIRDLATQVGADPDGVERDARNEVYRPVVANDRKRGKEMGVRGTPAVFVDGEPVGNTYDAISSAIDARV